MKNGPLQRLQQGKFRQAQKHRLSWDIVFKRLEGWNNLIFGYSAAYD